MVAAGLKIEKGWQRRSDATDALIARNPSVGTAGHGVLKVAKIAGCGSGTAQRVKREMAC
jgi:hypothetical protein